MANDQSNIVITLHRRHQMEPKQQLHKIRDAICLECGSIDNQRLLLCDMCDGGYHFSCVRPPLTCVPDGPWVQQAQEMSLFVTEPQGKMKKAKKEHE
ncbi:hypothetical protein L6452_40230 [Arctium lappa]|uniref:Uncharacterized protein n=1 Tax=Arctium lappa TaxID=4217 RepID=A0ACB8XLC0_ARCLA|nr:hypothetical protein L6452_40230 [Arctium lappa]